MTTVSKRESWMEHALRTWGEWVRDTAHWQGWGSGVDRAAIMADVGWGRSRTPGTYSNPVLAEVMALLHDGQGRQSMMHGEVLGLPSTERRVLVARYCGRPVLRRRSLEVDTVPIDIRMDHSDPELKVAHLPAIRARAARPKHPNICWLQLEWVRSINPKIEKRNGMMPFSEIGEIIRRRASSCHEAAERARLRLEFRLQVRRAIREGRMEVNGGSLRSEYAATHPQWYVDREREQEALDAAKAAA